MILCKIIRKRVVSETLLFVFPCLIIINLALNPYLGLALPITVISSVDGGYNRVIVNIHVNVTSEAPALSSKMIEIYELASSSCDYLNSLQRSIEQQLNESVKELDPEASIKNFNLSMNHIGLYRGLGGKHLELRMSYEVDGSIDRWVFGPHIINLGFRGVKANGIVKLGSYTFNPGEIFLLDLSSFFTPVKEWHRISVNGRVAFEKVEVKNMSKSTELGSLMYNLRQVIVLPADTVFVSYVGGNIVMYYTGLDVLSIFLFILTPLFIAILILLSTRGPVEKEERVFLEKYIKRG